MTVKEVLELNPATADVFRRMGMHCLGCPSATAESVAGAARTHGLDIEMLLQELNSVDLGDMSDETRADALPEGAIVQRDKQHFAIVPHIPGGLVDPATLRRIADVAEKYNCAAIKLTTAQRIALVGFSKEDVPKVWEELGMKPGAANGNRVRNIKFCPGTAFCKRADQDAIGLGLELDRRYHGMELPSQMKMAVSGCPRKCTDAGTVDIGVVGTPKGYTLMVGGSGGIKPRLARVLADGLDRERVLVTIDRVLDYYRAHAERNERLGHFLVRVGFDAFREAVMCE
ncbi:sulfite reductase [Clostridiales bacterium PH28_bin88]|nr:sulfite reductase [Clostridiales bacterium PH28_bin88]